MCRGVFLVLICISILFVLLSQRLKLREVDIYFVLGDSYDVGEDIVGSARV